MERQNNEELQIINTGLNPDYDEIYEKIPEEQEQEHFQTPTDEMSKPFSFIVTDVRLPQEDSYIRKNRCFILLLSLMVIGVAIGGLLYSDSIKTALQPQVEGYLQLRVKRGFFDIICAEFLSNAGIILFCFITSFFAISQPLIASIAGIKGMGIGITAAYFVSVYGFHGIIGMTILLLPGWIINSLITILSAKEGMRFASRQLRAIRGKQTDKDKAPFLTTYLIRFSLLFTGIFASSLINAIISILFGFMIEIN